MIVSLSFFTKSSQIELLYLLGKDKKIINRKNFKKEYLCSNLRNPDVKFEEQLDVFINGYYPYS